MARNSGPTSSVHHAVAAVAAADNENNVNDDDVTHEHEYYGSYYQHSSSTPTHDSNTITAIERSAVEENAKNVNEQADIAISIQRKQCPSLVKFVFGVSLLAIILYVVIDSLTTKHITNAFQSFLVWMETHIIAGIFAFTFVYFAATVLFVPGSILTLGSGFVFGTLMGLGPGVALASGVVLVGASLGAIVSFLIGRYLLRNWVESRLVHKYPMIQALDVAFRENGLTIFFLLRLSPVVPFNAINYIGGVTSMKFRHYIIALVGLIPGTVLYCFIGATAGSLTESKNAVGGPVAIASLVVGSVLGLLAIFAVSYYAKREFNKIVATEEERKREEHDGFSDEGYDSSLP